MVNNTRSNTIIVGDLIVKEMDKSEIEGEVKVQN